MMTKKTTTMFLGRLFALCSVLMFFLLLPPRVSPSASGSAESGPSETCLACHGQPEMRTASRPGIHVDAAKHAATEVHFYEALLAPFSILLWHFYMVIFDPVVYPMDLASLTGKVLVDHYRRTRPEYYRALRQAGRVREFSAEVEPAGKDAGPHEIKNPPRQG